MSQTFYSPGEVLSPTESVLAHPTHADGLVDSGDPVLIGTAEVPGVAEVSAAASTDKIACRVKGVVKLNVKGEDNSGNAAIAEGAILYYDTDGEINVDSVAGKKFGVALAAVGSGSTVETPVLLGKF